MDKMKTGSERKEKAMEKNKLDKSEITTGAAAEVNNRGGEPDVTAADAVNGADGPDRKTEQTDGMEAATAGPSGIETADIRIPTGDKSHKEPVTSSEGCLTPDIDQTFIDYIVQTVLLITRMVRENAGKENNYGDGVVDKQE
jgi:hypothetical protein